MRQHIRREIEDLVAELLANATFQLIESKGRTWKPKTAKDLNNGACGLVQEILVTRLREYKIYLVPCEAEDFGVRLKTGLHSWVWWNQWHFDAECPEGVEDWRDLPFFKRAKKRPKPRQSRHVQHARLLVSQDGMSQLAEMLRRVK